MTVAELEYGSTEDTDDGTQDTLLKPCNEKIVSVSGYMSLAFQRIA